MRRAQMRAGPLCSGVSQAEGTPHAQPHPASRQGSPTASCARSHHASPNRRLGCSAAPAYNHIAALRTLYNADLDFAEDNLAMQAALDLDSYSLGRIAQMWR